MRYILHVTIPDNPNITNVDPLGPALSVTYSPLELYPLNLTRPLISIRYNYFVKYFCIGTRWNKHDTELTFTAFFKSFVNESLFIRAVD